MHKLVISDDEGKTTVVPLVRDEITIGRREGNTIRLTERNVSRRHARLRRTDDGFVVEDLGSYNGVRINGSVVEGERLLGHGDRVGIGDYELALEEEGASIEDTIPSESVRLPAFEATERAAPARLVMLTAPAPGAEYALSGDVLKIGRTEELDIWVNHRSISREHAVFEREADAIVVRDLDSANGVRLNGEDVSEAELRSGDILELGQVRFRFVEEGEAYVYDAEDARIVQPAEESRGLKAPVVAAVLIIVLAVAVGAAIAVSTEDPAPDASAPMAVEAVPEGATTAQASELAEEAIRSCRAAVSARRFDDAVRFAAEALDHVPDSEAGKACHEVAVAGRAEAEIFSRGEAALAIGEVDNAYFIFAELPSDSPLWEHESVVGARAMFVERHLDLARRAMRREPVEATRHANIVLSVEDVSDEASAEAESIIARSARAVARAQRPRAASGRTRTVDDSVADDVTPAPTPAPMPAPTPAPTLVE